MEDFFENFDGCMDFEEPNFDSTEPDYNINEIEEENCILNFAKENTQTQEKQDSVVDIKSDDLFKKASVTTYNTTKEKKKEKPKEKKTITETSGTLKTSDSLKSNKQKNHIEITVEKQEEKASEKNEEEKIKTTKENTKKSITFDMNFDESKIFPEKEQEYYSENDIEILQQNETANKEVEVEYIQEQSCSSLMPQKDAYERKKTFIKKTCIMVAMIMVMISIPFVFSLANKNKRNITKEFITQNANSENTQMLFYDEAKRESEETLNNVTSSSRFANLDELTLYIDSTTGTILSTESQKVNMFNNNMITQRTFITDIQDCIAEANELNHLLIINKSVYEKEGRTEEYNRLMENLNTLIIYGDTAVYNACN